MNGLLHRMRGKAVSGAAASMAMLALASPASADPANNSLNVAFTGEITTLDFYKESNREGTSTARVIYDGLLYKDFETGELKPELASSYTVVDETTLDFVIREGVKFHDGTELTVDDVVYTLNLVSSDDYTVRYSIAVDWIDHAEKLDDRTVRIHMLYPYPLALEMLAGNVPIYPAAYYEEAGSEGMGVEPVGTGPFRLVEMTPGTRFVFERFKDYYRDSPKGFPAIERIDIQILPEANTQYVSVLNGSVDWIWRVPSQEASELAARGDIQVQNVSGVRFAYLAINRNYDGGNSPLADVRVRQAINHAINREAIVAALIGGAAVATEAPCAPIQLGCYAGLQKYPYDLDKAKALLADAGYAEGFDIELYVASIPTDQAQVVVDNLKAVGINATVNVQQLGTVTTAWREGQAALVLSNLGSFGIADVGIGAGQYFGGGDDDTTRDDEVIALFKQADETTDRAERQALLEEAIEHVTAAAYWAPLWTYNLITVSHENLEFTLTPDEYPRFYSARWR